MAHYVFSFLLLVAYFVASSQQTTIPDSLQAVKAMPLKTDSTGQEQLKQEVLGSEPVSTTEAKTNEEVTEMQNQLKEEVSDTIGLPDFQQPKRILSDTVDAYGKLLALPVKTFRKDSLLFSQEQAAYTPDSASVEKMEQQLEKEAGDAFLKKSGLPAENQVPDPKSQLQNELSGYQGMTANKLQSRETLYKMIKARTDQLGADYLEDVGKKNSKTLRQMVKDKKQLPDLPSTKVKDNTKEKLKKEQSLKERLVFGANMSVVIRTQTRISAAPELGYQVCPRILLGMGLSYQLNLRLKGNVPVLSEGQGLSTRVFGQYLLIGGFSLRGEYDWYPDKQKTEEGLSVVKDKLLGGVVKNFNLGRNVIGNVHVLYNFLYDPNIQPSNRMEYRIGFSLNPKHTSDKQK